MVRGGDGVRCEIEPVGKTLGPEDREEVVLQGKEEELSDMMEEVAVGKGAALVVRNGHSVGFVDTDTPESILDLGGSVEVLGLGLRR